MDQQKSSSTLTITKRAQISLLLFCTLGSIVFILIQQWSSQKKVNPSYLSSSKKSTIHRLQVRSLITSNGPLRVLAKRESTSVVLYSSNQAVNWLWLKGKKQFAWMKKSLLKSTTASSILSVFAMIGTLRKAWKNIKDATWVYFKCYIKSHHNSSMSLHFSGLLVWSFNGQGTSRPFKKDSFLSDSTGKWKQSWEREWTLGNEDSYLNLWNAIALPRRERHHRLLEDQSCGRFGCFDADHRLWIPETCPSVEPQDHRTERDERESRISYEDCQSTPTNRQWRRNGSIQLPSQLFLKQEVEWEDDVLFCLRVGLVQFRQIIRGAIITTKNHGVDS